MPHEPYQITPIPPPSTSALAAAKSHFLSPSRASNPPDTTLVPPPLLAALQIRYDVFVDEQRCAAAEEIDSEDSLSHHWVLYAPTPPTTSSSSPVDYAPAATIRLILPSYPSHLHHPPTGPAAPSAPSSSARSPPTATTSPPPISDFLTASTGDGQRPGFGVIEHPNYATSKIWDQKEPFAKIGRLATLKEFRGRGYGGIVVEEAVKWAGEHAGDVVMQEGKGEGEGRPWKGLICAHAQVVVKKWYEKMGFEVDEGVKVWMEEGIEHVAVWRRVGVGNEVVMTE